MGTVSFWASIEIDLWESALRGPVWSSRQLPKDLLRTLDKNLEELNSGLVYVEGQRLQSYDI